MRFREIYCEYTVTSAKNGEIAKSKKAYIGGRRVLCGATSRWPETILGRATPACSKLKESSIDDPNFLTGPLNHRVG